MIIKTDDLQGVEAIELLQEHRRDMLLYSPPESTHALDVDSLHAPDVTFWSVGLMAIWLVVAC